MCTQGRTHAYHLLCCPEGVHSKKAVLTGSNVFLIPSLLGAGYKCVNQIPDFSLGALLLFLLFVFDFWFFIFKFSSFGGYFVVLKSLSLYVYLFCFLFIVLFFKGFFSVLRERT